MTTQSAGKTLPVLITLVALVSAVFFYKQRDALRTKTQELLDQTSQRISKKLPEPTLFIPIKQYESKNASPTPTPLPQAEKVSPDTVARRQNVLSPAKGDSSPVKLASKTETICTPVYGMANSCAEHAVVDTALDTSVFYNLASLSYFAGLVAFVRAKKKA